MATPYHIGLYALVQHHGNYLMVRQAVSTLPAGPYGLPGAALVGEVGGGVAELHLRRKLLSQLGLSVGELILSGSHTLRNVDGHVLLNLIFGTDYNSGVPNPQPGVIVNLEWVSLNEVQRRGDAPEWLLNTIKSYQDHLTSDSVGRIQGRGLLRRGK
ncbi:hypothetical protein [Deinococcus sp.]|uniref:hypothetical protein n=1 Tax=Deinococcus sp. TaxID=47478 RepID=UPI003C7BC22A